MCYVCRADISKQGYGHFCQTAHCTHKDCNKCRLYTDTLEDDRIAMKEAGLQKLMEEQNKQQQQGEATGQGKSAAAGGAAKV